MADWWRADCCTTRDEVASASRGPKAEAVGIGEFGAMRKVLDNLVWVVLAPFSSRLGGIRLGVELEVLSQTLRDTAEHEDLGERAGNSEGRVAVRIEAGGCFQDVVHVVG